MAATAPDLGFLFNHAGHVVDTELTAKLAELGTTPREICVLGKALGAELTQSRLGELAGLDKTTMVVTMDELERAGLAERRPSSTDRRARIIAVTEAGERIVDDANAIVAGIYDEVLAELPAGQRDAFVAGLAQLAGGRLSTPAKCERPVRRRAVRAP